MQTANALGHIVLALSGKVEIKVDTSYIILMQNYCRKYSVPLFSLPLTVCALHMNDGSHSLKHLSSWTLLHDCSQPQWANPKLTET